MKYYLVFLLAIVFNTTFGFSTESPKVFFYENISEGVVGVSMESSINFKIPAENTAVQQPKFRKLKAVLLAIFLGHFGVHRIYLGTSSNVPVVYSLTLGGGFGLLPLMDIIAIIKSKDLSEFEGNEKVIMWIK